MMKVGHPSKLRVLVIALIFGSVMVLGQTQRADAYNGGGELGLVMLYVMFLSTASAVCVPVAAASSKEFGEAYGNCFLPLVGQEREPIFAENAEDAEQEPEPREEEE
jgi:hypothetical protein